MNNQLLIGWREWVSLPDLELPHIKAKIDSGARTSTLHAFTLKPYTKKGVQRVKFSVHPLQNNSDIVVECDALVADRRDVTDSGGHREKRYVIETTVQLGNSQWTIEMTLTNRDSMKFRMLLGRTAMCPQFLIDPGKSFVEGKKPHGLKRSY